jgi:fatty acid desaturase
MLKSTLTRRRTHAWPTIILAGLALSAWGVQLWLGSAGAWPAWAALIGNSICAYILFTPAHDAAHGAVARSRWINDWVGRVCILPLNPFFAFAAFRYLHLQHHRTTNEPDGDPDFWASGSRWWALVSKFATVDLAYWAFYLRRLPKRPVREALENGASLSISVGALISLSLLGFGREILLFWILPGRVAIFVLAWMFDYLPHRPHTVAQKDDRFRATNIRVGMERWLSPLTLWQNYHLVHHLYPKEPFWLTVELWRKNERGHLEQSPCLVDVWGRSLTTRQYVEVRAHQGSVDLTGILPAQLTDPGDSPARWARPAPSGRSLLPFDRARAASPAAAGGGPGEGPTLEQPTRNAASESTSERRMHPLSIHAQRRRGSRALKG